MGSDSGTDGDGNDKETVTIHNGHKAPANSLTKSMASDYSRSVMESMQPDGTGEGSYIRRPRSPAPQQQVQIGQTPQVSTSTELASTQEKAQKRRKTTLLDEDSNSSIYGTILSSVKDA